MPHEHEWGRGYREVDVPVIDGVATMPDGRTIESTANSVRYPEPIDDFVCGVCGATRDTPAEHPQTAEGRPREEIRQEWFRLRRDSPSDPRVAELRAMLDRLPGDPEPEPWADELTLMRDISEGLARVAGTMRILAAVRLLESGRASSWKEAVSIAREGATR